MDSDQLQVASIQRIHQSALKVKEKLRINSLKIVHFDARDEKLVQASLQQVQLFINGLHLNIGLTSSNILQASQDAHRASDEYYTMRHAQAWNTDFVIPQEAIDADSALFRACNHDFAEMCRRKQSLLAANRISKERILAIFGHRGERIQGVDAKDVQIVIEFAVYGITPPTSESFKAEAHDVAPLRNRYIKLNHTINKLLYKLYQDGTMIFLDEREVRLIPSIHLSPQHHADSKGKPECRIIADLSGQHNETSRR